MSMLPPQLLPDSQESCATTTSSTSADSFPSNGYAPTSTTDPTSPSSQSGHNTTVSSQQSTDGANSKQLEPGASVGTAVAAGHGYPPRASPVERTSSTSSPSSSHTAQSPTTHGSKRTASRTIKSPTSIYPTSPGMTPKYGHNRNTSIDTTASSVGELSAQLKSRLSHAMAKVNKNRMYGSPSTPTSPPSASSNSNGYSNGRTNTYSNGYTHHLQPQTKTKTLSQVLHDQDQQSHYMYPDGSRATESYSRSQPVPLAPAPSLLPSTATSTSTSRSTQHRRPPASTSTPRLQTHVPNSNANGASDLEQRRAETPTQQEQEAVDTLIFMSSPANSSRFPRSSGENGIGGLRSPKREVFYPHSHPAKRRSLGAGRMRDERDVDRMLDQIGREGSFSEVEAETQIEGLKRESPDLDADMEKGPPTSMGSSARVTGGGGEYGDRYANGYGDRYVNGYGDRYANGYGDRYANGYGDRYANGYGDRYGKRT